MDILRLFNYKKNKYDYQNEIPYKKRCEESQDIISKYPTYIPVIINTKEDIELQKRKFLVPPAVFTSYLIFHIRKHIINQPNKAIFLFVNGTVLDSLKTIGERYDEYMSTHNQQDKYFYIDLYFENTFGFLKFSM